MKHLYAKMTFRIILISFLALILIGCGESGSPGGSSGIGITSSISLTAVGTEVSEEGVPSAPADGVTSLTITATMLDSVNKAVSEQTKIVFRTNLGTFRNGQAEYSVKTADASGTVAVQLTSDTAAGMAEVWVESNDVTQKVDVKFYDPQIVAEMEIVTGNPIVADGISQTRIEVIVKDRQENPEEGVTVSFNTTLGQFIEANPLPGIINQNTTATTDVDGIATVMLVSGKTIGTATINASTGGMNVTGSVLFIAGEPDTIALRAAPSTIRPGGTTTLFAKIEDVYGNPIEDQSIVFSNTVNASGGTLSPLSSTTNENGEAQVSYVAGGDPGVDIIQAALSSDLGLNTTASVVVDPGAIVIDAIAVTAGSPSLVANGLDKVTIRAVVTDNEGNPATGKTVNFSTTAGKFDTADGLLSNASETTSDIGLAQIKLQSSTISGPVTITAECDGFIGNVSVEFVPGEPHHILMYAIPDTVAPNGAFETAAIIQDQYDNRIDDKRLRLEVRRAVSTKIVDTAELTPDQAQDGVYRFEWTAATVYGPGNLEITARVNNEVSATVTVIVDEAAIVIDDIDVIAGAESLVADGKSSTTIRATVTANGEPAVGITVDFSSTLGSLSSLQKTTDANGIAEVTLKTRTLWGTAKVIADANGFQDQVEVLFTSGTIGGISLTAVPDVVAPGEKADIIAEATDSRGAPVADETLYFNIYDNVSNGELSAISGQTDSNGRVTIEYTAGVIDLGTDRIRVTSASNSGRTNTTDIRVVVATGNIGYITLTSDKETLTADGISSARIEATVFDTGGTEMPEGTPITLSTTLGTFPGGVDPDGSGPSGGPISSQIEVFTTDDTGIFITSLIAPATGTGIATITAASGEVTQSTIATITSIEIPDGEILSISTSKTSVLTNGTDFATITAVVLDEDNVPIEGKTVNFSSSGGQISDSSVLTDENGAAIILFSSGPDKFNNTIVVTATVESLTQSVPITLYGTEVLLSPATAQLSIDTNSTDPGTEEIIVTVLDANDIPVYGADVSFSNVSDPAFSAFTLEYYDFDPDVDDFVTYNMTTSPAIQTDYSGNILLLLTAGDEQSADGLTLRASALNTFGEGVYTFGNPLAIFKIIAPVVPPDEEFAFGTADGTSTVEVRIQAGGLTPDDNVVFATSFGTWENGFQTIITDLPDPLANPNEYSHFLSSDRAGVATVQVYSEADPAISDSVQIEFVNPAEEACDIVIQPAQTNILPSTETSSYSIVIEASVVDEFGGPVGGAPVSFSLSNTTGGGENIFPTTAISDPSGIARTTFTSGTLGTGSEQGAAVQVTARVDTPPCNAPDNFAEDSVNIVISGAVANVSIGSGTAIESSEDSTLYELPISVLVADTNGNPVSGSEVSLSLKPSQYATGAWFEFTTGWEVIYYNPCFGFGTANLQPTGFINEDLNNNAVLDDREDELGRYEDGAPGFPDYFLGYAVGDRIPGLNNGVLTPGQSAGGTIPASVTTDASGVATFTLTYQKRYAIWIEDQITATVMVSGTEYITRSRSWLPYATDEEEEIRNAFPQSPFNVLPCGTVEAWVP